MYEKIIMAQRKTDADGLVREFHNGIKNDTLGLTRLKPETVEQKKKQGKPKPSVPLYGLGDLAGDRSLSNALMIRKLKSGYKVSFSNRKHHSAGMKLSELWLIHENGAKIIKGDKIIQIPPRHPFKKAYQSYLSKMKKNKKETSRHVKRALTEYINTGKTTMLKKLEKAGK